MPKFKLKTGKHREDGVTYGKNEEAGNIVDSPHDLVKLFPEKFEAVGGEASAPSDTTALVGTVVKDTPQTKKSGGKAVPGTGARRAAKAGFPAKKVDAPAVTDDGEDFAED